MLQSGTLGKCARKVGDLQAGVLLFDLLLSLCGSTVPRGRKRWVAKSRDEYVRDTGLTLEQYKRAAAVVRRRGIVGPISHSDGLCRGQGKSLVKSFGGGQGRSLRAVPPILALRWGADVAVGG